MNRPSTEGSGVRRFGLRIKSSEVLPGGVLSKTLRSSVVTLAREGAVENAGPWVADADRGSGPSRATT